MKTFLSLSLCCLLFYTSIAQASLPIYTKISIDPSSNATNGVVVDVKNSALTSAGATTTTTAAGVTTTTGLGTIATTTAAGTTVSFTTAAGTTVSFTTAGVMANAAFTTLVSQASISMINNQGDIGAVLKELGSEDSLESCSSCCFCWNYQWCDRKV